MLDLPQAVVLARKVGVAVGVLALERGALRARDGEDFGRGVGRRRAGALQLRGMDGRMCTWDHAVLRGVCEGGLRVRQMGAGRR